MQRASWLSPAPLQVEKDVSSDITEEIVNVAKLSEASLALRRETDRAPAGPDVEVHILKLHPFISPSFPPSILVVSTAALSIPVVLMEWNSDPLIVMA